MLDFKGKLLSIGDNVIFIYDKHKRNELKEGVVLKTDIKQASYVMALVSWKNNQDIEVESRVSQHKIFKKD